MQLSEEKKEIVKLYDRSRRRAKRFKISKHSPSYNKIVYRSKQVLKILGTDSVQHCQVLGHVLKQSLNSPTKRKGILQKCQEISGCFKEDYIDDKFKTPQKDLNSALRKLAIYRSARKYDKAREMVDIIKSKTKSIAAVASESGNKYSHVYRLMKSPKKRVVKEYTRNFSDFQKQEAIDIFLDDEVSYSLPDVKYSHLRFMSCTIADAYNKHYLVKSTSKRKVGQSTFAGLKPLFVRSISETPLRGCKCEYCQNLGLIRETLIALGFKGISKNHACSIEITWCLFRTHVEKDERASNIHNESHECSIVHEHLINVKDLPGKNCVLRQCVSCGIEKYRKTLRSENRILLRTRGYVQWTQWKQRKVFNGKKNVKRMLPNIETGTYEDIFKEYMKQLKTISVHQFMKVWQLKNFNMSLRNLRKGQLLLVHDFSQNLLLILQEEVSSAHWDHAPGYNTPYCGFLHRSMWCTDKRRDYTHNG